MTEPLIAVEQAETVVVVLLQVGGGWRADLEDMLPNDASTRLENESEWIVELVGDIVVLIAAEEVIDIKFGDLEGSRRQLSQKELTLLWLIHLAWVGWGES